MCQDCERLYEELQKQSEVMYGLRRRIRSLRNELKGERHKNEQFLKEKRKNRKDHLRKGQKRSRHGRI